jgi:hypothetical protein
MHTLLKYCAVLRARDFCEIRLADWHGTRADLNMEG